MFAGYLRPIRVTSRPKNSATPAFISLPLIACTLASQKLMETILLEKLKRSIRLAKWQKQLTHKKHKDSICSCIFSAHNNVDHRHILRNFMVIFPDCKRILNKVARHEEEQRSSSARLNSARLNTPLRPSNSLYRLCPM